MHAEDTALLDTLLENGVLTREQHAELSEQQEQEQQQQQQQQQQQRGADDRASVESGPDGFALRSADDRHVLELTGRLHADWARHRDLRPPAEAIDGTEIRRARIGVAGRLDDIWRFNGEIDLADDDAPIKDFWLRYAGWENVALTVGHQKQPYSLGLEMSSNDLPFVERGIDNALITPFVDRAIGVRADVSRGRWFAAGGVYGESTEGGTEGWGTSARFVFAPVADERRVVHIGIRAAYREPDSAGSPIRIRGETTSFSSLYIVDSGPLASIEHTALLGPEALVVLGRLALTAEHTSARLSRENGDLDFSGWHAAATWTVGGESRAAAYALADGELKALRPVRSFSRDGGGTWELAVRYASLDLNDGEFRGGTEQRLTLGANWYATSRIRALIDWTRIVDTDESSAVRASADGADVLTVRMQYAF